MVTVMTPLSETTYIFHPVDSTISAEPRDPTFGASFT